MEQESNKISLNHNPYARATPFSPVVRVLPKISRNSMCPLSLKKFKHCCGSSGQDFCNKAKENLENYVNELREKSKDDKSS
jgi:hypothetical protein